MICHFCSRFIHCSAKDIDSNFEELKSRDNKFLRGISWTKIKTEYAYSITSLLDHNPTPFSMNLELLAPRLLRFFIYTSYILKANHDEDSNCQMMETNILSVND